jgi:alkylhydroperoxidase/carboxymuconolactone decarboxylase family protein YurZ
MARLQKPPRSYEEFVRRFPKLGQAWELLGDAATEAGPLEAKTQRLVKLALAIASRQEGAVHSGVRKALASGATLDELDQVVALAASLVGLPATVAAFQWVREEAEKGEKKP